MEAAGNRVLVTRVQPIAGVERRARRLGEQIVRAFGDEPVHLIGHSMGGLDARRLLADESWQERILSLTTIGTPHLGSSLADFAKLRVGRVYRLLEALKIDPQGCLDVTRKAARRFHERFARSGEYSLFLGRGRSARARCLLAAAASARGALRDRRSQRRPGLGRVGQRLRSSPAKLAGRSSQADELARAGGAWRRLSVQPLELHAEIVEHLASLGFGSRAVQSLEIRLLRSSAPAGSRLLLPGSSIG